MFNHHTSNKTIVFTLLFITLFIGFFFNENSSGGALPDFLMRIEIINSFHNDFIGTFLNYNQYSDRHSPLILILITMLLKSGLDIKYPFLAKKNNLSGTVVLSVKVGKTGVVEEIKLKTSSGHKILDQEAIKQLNSAKFNPKTIQGKPVASNLDVAINFRI